MMKGQSKERVLKQSQGRENNAKRWGKGYQFEAQETEGGKTVQTNKFEARERSYYWKGREKQCRAQKKTSACILLLQNRYLVGSAGTWSTSSEIEHLTCISLCLNCLEMFFINPFT